ncbi:LCP family protein [Amycolatopsis cihanbeyliensis]
MQPPQGERDQRPARPSREPRAEQAEQTRVTSAAPPPRRRPPRQPAAPPLEPIELTDQLEPVGEATMQRRQIDETLARFSAAHDELAAEEQERKQRRDRLLARPAQLLEQTRTKLQRVVLTGEHKRPDSEMAAEEAEPAEEPEPDPEQAPEKKSPQTRLQEKKSRRNHRSLLTARITAAVVAGLVFLATGVGWGAKTWFNGKFNEIAALDEGSNDIRNAAGQTGDENFLIVGSDTREGAEVEDNVGSATAIPGARSDTVMLAHIPADRKQAVVVSFPRDLEVSRPDCERWDPESGEYGEVVRGATQVKLNSAFRAGGPRCVTKVIQQLSGMKVNHFVGIDFNGFKHMVDAVGGVRIHTDGPVKDQELGLIIAEKGEVVISGDQALNYVRARKVYGDPTFSDYGRIKRQQQFLSSLLQATLSRDVLFDVGKLTGFVNAFASATFGENIGIDQMLTLAQSMQGLRASKVRFLTIPTVGEANDRGNEVLLEEQSSELFRALIDNTPLPDEKGSRQEPSEQALPSE